MDKFFNWFKSNKIFLVGTFISIITFLFTKEFPFFWDALSSSSLSLWFYNHQFSQFVVPTEINPGHYPLWSLLMAYVWLVFGKTILVSRFLLLFVNIVIAFEIQTLINTYKQKKIAWYWYVILFLETTFWAQTTSINNDILLLLFCLMGINNHHKKNVIYAVALTGILFSNLRGMFFVSGFFAYEIYKNPKFLVFKTKNALNTYLLFVVPFVLFVAFGLYQYNILGWVLRSPVSAAHRGVVGFTRAVKNTIAIVWQFLDQGRFLFLLITFYYLIVGITKRSIDPKTKELLQISLFLGVPTILVMIVSSNPVGHRYFMLFFLLLLLVYVNFIGGTKLFFVKWIGALVLLISGHFWIYPETHSQGWDSSFAHVHYFELKNKMKNFIKEQGISYTKVGCKTTNPTREVEYLDCKKVPQYVEYADLKDVEYYMHTNVDNNTKDAEIAILKTDWELIKEYSSFGVFIRLYKSPIK